MKTLLDVCEAIEKLKSDLLFGAPWDTLDDDLRPVQSSYAHLALHSLEAAQSFARLAVLNDDK